VIRSILLTISVLVGLVAFAAAQSPAPPAAKPCADELSEARTTNQTVTQLWRDINDQRVSYEIQIATIRSQLGVDTCPPNQPVSACVAKLHAQYVDLAQKHAKLGNGSGAAAPKSEPKK